jgi:2-keto-4-pentenoate hydratase
VRGKATQDGSAIGEGHGRDILGHPFHSVGWPAAHLAARGESLNAGQIVMTGSVMKTIFPTAEATYGFSLDGIGDVNVIVR